MYIVLLNLQILPDYGDVFEFASYNGIRLASVISPEVWKLVRSDTSYTNIICVDVYEYLTVNNLNSLSIRLTLFTKKLFNDLVTHVPHPFD